MTDFAPPILCIYEDGVFKPARPAQELRAKRYYENGKLYPLVIQHERSMRSHRHFFACVHEAWTNLPEEYGDEFPTSEHLRKHALIKTGFRHERTIAGVNEKQVPGIIAAIREYDEFAYFIVDGPVLRILTAESQSERNMGKEKFQRSKNEVLEFISNLIGTSRAQLERNAGAAA